MDPPLKPVGRLEIVVALTHRGAFYGLAMGGRQPYAEEQDGRPNDPPPPLMSVLGHVH